MVLLGAAQGIAPGTPVQAGAVGTRPAGGKGWRRPMFISDFAIKRPIVTVVTMLALVIFGIFALLNLRPTSSPTSSSRSSVVAGPLPRRLAREGRAGGGGAGGGGVLRHQRRRQIAATSLDGFGAIIVQFVFEKDLQQATQDIRDAISADPQRPARRDEGAGADAVRSRRPGRSSRWRSPRTRSSRPELTRSPIPAITRELRGDRRRGRR